MMIWFLKSIKDKIIEKEPVMKRIFIMGCMVMFLGMFLIPGEAAAFNSMDVQKLKTTNQCPDCDLSGADLREAKLYRADRTGTYLSGASLQRATWIDGLKCKDGSFGQCIK